jgi:transposase
MGFEGDSVPAAAVARLEAIGDSVVFRTGEVSRIFVGDVPLAHYVERSGLRLASGLRDLISQLDLDAFTSAYKPGGRPPIHPRVLLGLIVYGIHLKQSSLRELELLAVRDVGAWLLCEGIQPDHSTIGKFIVRHEELLSDAFFVSATRRLAQKLGLTDGELAADGTVVQAATGLRSFAKKSVLEEEAEAARRDAEASGDVKLERQASRLENAAEVARKRAEKREEYGRSEPHVSRTEPEAVNQPCKDGLYRPAYKPSVLVHEARLILGQTVDPSSEVAALNPMLDQADSVGIRAVSLALDTGYFEPKVLQLAVTRDIDLICPPGRKTGAAEGPPLTKNGLFAKAAFKFDDEKDIYICPAGAPMTPGSWTVSRGLRYRAYGTRACKTCALKAQCTSSKHPRHISRVEGEELKEAMEMVLAQAQARRRYRRRAAIVEPIFAELKERQGLKRFRRRGPKGARVEFALHCLAFNLKRVAVVVVFAVVSIRLGDVVRAKATIAVTLRSIP